MALFWYVVHSSHDMFCLPPGVLDKPNKVQRMQRTHESRLDVHLPLFFLVPSSVVLFFTIGGRCEMTPLALDDLRERLVPVVYVDHAPRVEVSSEEDARVGQLPDGHALGHRRVILGRRKERVGLE